MYKLLLAHCSILLINKHVTEIALWKFLFKKISYFFLLEKHIRGSHSFLLSQPVPKIAFSLWKPHQILVVIFIFEGQIHGVIFPVLLNAASQAFTVTHVFPARHKIHSELKKSLWWSSQTGCCTCVLALTLTSGLIVQGCYQCSDLYFCKGQLDPRVLNF